MFGRDRVEKEYAPLQKSYKYGTTVFSGEGCVGSLLQIANNALKQPSIAASSPENTSQSGLTSRQQLRGLTHAVRRAVSDGIPEDSRFSYSRGDLGNMVDKVSLSK